jgi:hypothetical protein
VITIVMNDAEASFWGITFDLTTVATAGVATPSVNRLTQISNLWNLQYCCEGSDDTYN